MTTSPRSSTSINANQINPIVQHSRPRGIHCGVLPVTSLKDSTGNEQRYYIFGVHPQTEDLCIFGGKAYLNENFRKAALREFQEESEGAFPNYEIEDEYLTDHVYLLIARVPPIVPEISNIEIKETCPIRESELYDIVTGKSARKMFAILIPALRLLLGVD
jgi:hypothetical protein